MPYHITAALRTWQGCLSRHARSQWAVPFTYGCAVNTEAELLLWSEQTSKCDSCRSFLAGNCYGSQMCIQHSCIHISDISLLSDTIVSKDRPIKTRDLSLKERRNLHCDMVSKNQICMGNTLYNFYYLKFAVDFTSSLPTPKYKPTAENTP